MVRKRMYDRGHGMVRWVSWILQLVTEIRCAFATHLLRMCSTSSRQVHLIYCREREAVMFGLWYERVWDGLMRCAAAVVLVARQNLVVCVAWENVAAKFTSQLSVFRPLVVDRYLKRSCDTLTR